jgi:oligopeptide transport system permease protein
MGRYLEYTLRRCIQFCISIGVLVVLSFALLKVFPGSPFSDETTLNPQVQAQLELAYGLNDPLPKQISKYIESLLSGDFGTSMRYPGRKVSTLILEFGATSLKLGFAAFAIALFGSLFLVIFVRKVKSKNFDHTARLFGSLPTIVLGPLLIWFLGLKLELLPVALLEGPTSYILPIFLLSLKPLISLTRVLANSVDQVFAQDYVRTARSLGFSETDILKKWALKNALASYVIQTGPMFAHLISGSFLIEILFAIQGLGLQFVDSALARDWPMIIGLSLFYSSLLMLSQLLSDLALLKVDPRIAR